MRSLTGALNCSQMNRKRKGELSQELPRGKKPRGFGWHDRLVHGAFQLAADSFIWLRKVILVALANVCIIIVPLASGPEQELKISDLYTAGYPQVETADWPSICI